MNGPLPPRDRGDRRPAAERPSGHRRLVPGALRLGNGITNVGKHAGRHAACKAGACTRALRQSKGLGRTDIRSQYLAFALAVQDGSYPTEVATAMRYKRMSEGRRKLNVWTRPQER